MAKSIWRPVRAAYLPLVIVIVDFVLGGPGTTPNIIDIFRGRCFEYQQVFKDITTQNDTKNCTQLWDYFQQAWTHRDPKLVRTSDYNSFYEITKPTSVPVNKTLLWSGIKAFAQRYAIDGRGLATLESSLIGYLVNGLTWCGMVCDKCDGINYKECPDFKDLPIQAAQAFWGGASSMFASRATGQVKIMLTGSNPSSAAYRRDSYFATFEMTSLSKAVTPLIILVNELGKPALEHCQSGSLLLLREDLQKRGLSFDCQENPPDVMHLMCVPNPDAEECKCIPRQKGILSRTFL